MNRLALSAAVVVLVMLCLWSDDLAQRLNAPSGRDEGPAGDGDTRADRVAADPVP